jgi:hypothetical protein
MRSGCVVRSSGCQCQSRNSRWFDSSILRHSRILWAADEEALINIHKKVKNSENPPLKCVSVPISGQAEV